MRLLALVSAGVCLLTTSLVGFVAGTQDPGDPQEKRYEVEVVSADPSARTLTIRSDAGTSTLLVGVDALRSLEGLTPGDRISISVQDPATGQSRAISATVDGAARARGAADTAPAPTVRKITTVTWLGSGDPVEFRSWDPVTRRLTVRAEGQDQVFVIDRDADVDFDTLVPGQQVLLSWRFNKAGKAEAVIRTLPLRATAVRSDPIGLKTAPVRMRGPVEVVSTNPGSRTLRVRDEHGLVVALPVDEKAVVSLEAVKAGDLILLSWRNDRVTLITRK
jgi:hypothetical protein